MMKAKSVLRSERGFSLVELMIVVAIIGILATIAVPNFQKFQAKARQTEAKNVLSAMYMAEKAFFAEWGQYFADFRALGYCPEGNVKYRHGFGAAGAVTAPGSWTAGTAGISPGALAAQISSTGGLGAPNVPIAGCTFREILAPVAPGPLQGTSTVTAADRFTAEARGDIDGDAVVDLWTINQDKVLAQPVPTSIDL